MSQVETAGSIKYILMSSRAKASCCQYWAETGCKHVSISFAVNQLGRKRTKPVPTRSFFWRNQNASGENTATTEVQPAFLGTYYYSEPSTPSSSTLSAPANCSPVYDDIETSNSSQRGYGKWGKREEKLLVQLWCERHTRLGSKNARKVWEEIAAAVSQDRLITSAQCQRKIKYLKDRYKEAKHHNRNQTGGDRKTSPFYDELDSVLGYNTIQSNTILYLTTYHTGEEAGTSAGATLNDDEGSNSSSRPEFEIQRKRTRQISSDSKEYCLT
ncbi:hypothetical protein OS493_001488 [Desmophyllum pertusum]|uniref:Myb/SANT-like DNA-binding domain-containing protein n=1 Tax=Desmophyllum pertusum TaxID=174260 RepID=A0A9X0CZJ6_9CNID|nr:hypothetical protein OS493_001488 [Desmophyllum pertusum]